MPRDRNTNSGTFDLADGNAVAAFEKPNNAQ
jgi:hypothetical protein